MNQESHVKTQIKKAKKQAFSALEIIYEFKCIKSYVPNNAEMQMLIEFSDFLKVIYEDTNYIISCMQCRRNGQHEHEYLRMLAEKAFKDINERTK